MTTALGIFLRGVAIVSLVAWNVRHVAALEYAPAFFTGVSISAIWWLNAGLAGETRKRPKVAVWYGLGGGVGTVVGMWLGR